MKTNSKCDVLIVGAGPTGLMMACQLALLGISFRIIDKTADHTSQSRALVMQARSVEILDQMGIAEKALVQGKIAKAAGAFFNGKKIMRLVVNHIGGDLTKFPFLLMLEQSRTEKILIDFLESHSHYVDRKYELISLTDTPGEVISKVKTADHQEEIISSKYVVGCDGAHSMVREQTGIPFDGKTYEQSLFVMDCKARVEIPDDEMYLAFTADAIAGFFPLTNGRWRVLGTLPHELEGKKDITFEDIAGDFASRVHMNVELYDPQWVSVYHSHHRHASAFRKDRCFLAGDAAHIHSPVGAQGMNTGLQDAYNLAWKLAMVIKGKAHESLLDTYNEERIKIAKQLVKTTDRAFNLITNTGGIFKYFRLHVMPFGFKYLAPQLQKFTFVQRFAFRLASEIGIHYRESSLSENASLGEFPRHAPHPGDRLPFIKFHDDHQKEVSIQDQMRVKKFCILVFGTTIPEELHRLAAFGYNWFSTVLISKNAGTENLYKGFGVNDEAIYVVRPDMYIAYRAEKFDKEHLNQYLTRYLNISLHQ